MDQADANATQTGGDISSMPHDQFMSNPGDVINTVDDGPGMGGINATEGDVDTKGAENKDGGEKAKPYHQDPDWQRMMKERDDARMEAATTKARLEEREKLSKPAEPKEDKPLPYKDITKMSKEDLLEWFEDDPVGYEANKFQQFLHEAKQVLETERSNQQKTASVQGTYEKYQNANPDFKEKWASGEIQKYMDDNPGHNAISAHMAMTETTRIEAAVAKATKEAEERVIKNFQAKRSATVISGGPGAKGKEGVPDELKNPKQYGGTTSVIANRLRAMRQALTG